MKKILISAIAILILCSCNRGGYIMICGYAQGGTYEVKCHVPDVDASKAGELKNGIDSILDVIDRSVSGYNPGSLLSKYNSGLEVIADNSPEYEVFKELEQYCDSLYTATEGVLDTRAAELYDVWGFGFRNGKMPSEEEVRAALSDRSKMNFNAVAQGYSADKVALYLIGEGISDMMVNIGGEIYCSGVNPNGSHWTLGIDRPYDGNERPGEDMSCTFNVPSVRLHGVVTSGNYRKFYVVDGVKYSHTVDPRTGYPVRHDLLSATIMAPEAALADAIATYCMVIGKEEAIRFIESREDIEGCLISSDSMWCSGGFILNQ